MAMKTTQYVDEHGEHQDERRKETPLRGLPAWVDYGVILGIISLIFWGGVQANRLDTIARTLDSVQNQMTVLQASSPKAEVAVLQEKSHEADQAISDLKDTLLRRMDRLEVKIDDRNRTK